MGKLAKEDDSDDIEIISIGKLYNGPWDKKYWSSSRGKDRYPYPVGYKSLRSQNGITYTMEILEGHKGPSFMITATNGKSCLGDTPDIAWERFQKGCSKLWHGKRFSCKIDGVEFFGFKNTFVQRLLRELVANVGGTAEQSLQPSNDGAFKPIDQLESRTSIPDSDLFKLLSTPRVTGKRSRKDKNCNNKKRLNGTHFERQQENCTKNYGASNPKQSDQSISGNRDPSTFVTIAEIHYSPTVSGPESSADVIKDVKNQPIVERNMQVDSLCVSNHLKEESSLPEEDRANADNLLLEPEPISLSMERGGVTNVEQDLAEVNDADLCAPDTWDPADDSPPVSSPKTDAQVHLTVKDATANDITKPEVLVTDSSPDEETGRSVCNSSAEKCDTDSVGQGIAESMMTLLLPRALPLLKTFSRRKKKNAKPLKSLVQGSQEENKIHEVTVADGSIAMVLPEHSYSERKNENIVIPCAESAGPAYDSTYSVVPDSFDTDNPEDLLYAAKVDQALCSLKQGEQLPTNVNEESNLLGCVRSIEQDTGMISDVIEKYTADKSLALAEEVMANSKGSQDEHSSINMPLMEEALRSKCALVTSSSDVGTPEKCEAGFAKVHKTMGFADCDNSSLVMQIPSASCPRSMFGNKTNDDSRSNDQPKVMLHSVPACIPKFFACYVHPMPISFVELIVKHNEIFICVECGNSEYKESRLFVYKALVRGDKMGCPSLIGHMPIALQSSTNALDRDNAVERSLLQFSPCAQSIVLLNSIKTPYCREGNIHCSCPACTSNCSENNAVKIVKVNSGYASLVTRLETSQRVCCLLVCRPSFLLAAEEDGKLKLWIMNCEWSGQVEEWYLPTFDSMLSTIVVLKNIPNSARLVLGHNGFGEFALWDIEKRNLVSRFSSLGLSVIECIPASIFRWQRKPECNSEVVIDEIMNATKTWRNENHMFSPEDKDTAVWLLIATVPDPDSLTPEREAPCWRLALLINNKVIVGASVDGSSCASVTSEGHGIIGRCDGSIYVWELTTGKKLETLHSPEGSRVTCIATTSHALAIAAGDRILIYLSWSCQEFCQTHS